MKQLLWKRLFVLLSLLVMLVPSLLAESITFVDVSVGDSEKDSSCIFKVNGNTVVVDWHETVVVDGITIFVQDIYPVNTAAQDQDSCKFLYSSSGSAKEESLLKKAQIGDKILTFFLGTRADASAAEETNTEETETGSHETPETTRVLIDGYDVTPDSSDAAGDAVAVAEEAAALPDETTKDDETTPVSNAEEKGFFSRFFAWILGKE